MAIPIKQLSESRVGQEWRASDHAAVCHAVDEIERTAAEMVRAAMGQVKTGTVCLRVGVAGEKE